MRLILASIAALTAMTGVAMAEPQNCAERDAVVSKLQGTFGEAFSGGGLQTDTSVFEVWTSPDDGTWTILMTRADGVSCVMASGTNWRPGGLTEAVKGTPS